MLGMFYRPLSWHTLRLVCDTAALLLVQELNLHAAFLGLGETIEQRRGD